MFAKENKKIVWKCIFLDLIRGEGYLEEKWSSDQASKVLLN